MPGGPLPAAGGFAPTPTLYVPPGTRGSPGAPPAPWDVSGPGGDIDMAILGGSGGACTAGGVDLLDSFEEGPWRGLLAGGNDL